MCRPKFWGKLLDGRLRIFDRFGARFAGVGGKTGMVFLRRGEGMVIRPLVAANALGETGRSAAKRGTSGGPAAFFSNQDSVALGGKPVGAKLYSASPLFKMMGAVELMSDEFEMAGSDFSDNPALI